jgi:SAM-dependent methyltransferase
VTATLDTSDQYWRRLFMRNPDFCSWQAPKQRRVLDAVRSCLSEPAGRMRVLDFGIGSLGLYRALGDGLMRRLQLTGTSESQQHDTADSLLARHAVEIKIGPGLSPLAPLSDGSQDRVVCSYVFDYLSDRARAEALGAFARVLVDGGKLLLVLHHPRGKRAEKFHRSRPYWSMARSLYEQLRSGRYAEASTLRKELTALLHARFGDDDRYRGYLESYLRIADLFMAHFCDGGRLVGAVPEQAWNDCEQAARLIDRELAMTSDALRPIEQPARDLALPRELKLCDVVEHADPTDGSPMAYVLTATKES